MFSHQGGIALPEGLVLHDGGPSPNTKLPIAGETYGGVSITVIKEIPSWVSIPANVDLFDIQDEMPEGAKYWGMGSGLRNGKAGGASETCTNLLKLWIRGIIEEDNLEKDQANRDY